MSTEEASMAGAASVTIWGARGSIAAPEHAQGLYGGNTSCISISLPDHRYLVFDAGTGIRALGKRIVSESPLRLALCFTHFHWDHIFGLPFFAPLFVPDNEVQVYGPAVDSDELTLELMEEMGGDFFPISVDAFRAQVSFFGLGEQRFETLGVSVSTLYTNHPCKTFAYRVDMADGSLVYAPDNELDPEVLRASTDGQTARLVEFARGASLLLHDSTYSRDEYEKRRGWGHSCGESLAAFAAAAEVGRVLLFHHDPDNDDTAVKGIHQEFEQAMRRCGSRIPGEPAREGATYELDHVRLTKCIKYSLRIDDLIHVTAGNLNVVIPS